MVATATSTQSLELWVPVRANMHPLHGGGLKHTTMAEGVAEPKVSSGWRNQSHYPMTHGLRWWLT